MSVSTTPVGGAFAAIVGADGVSDDPGTLATAAIDGRAPRWIVAPATVDELSRVVALAHDARLAVVPRGSGHALELGQPPPRLDVVVDLRRLARIVEYSPDDLTVTVEAGVTGGQLASLLAGHRQFLPIDPPGVRDRTLGGLVATSATGPLRCRYGSLRDLLLGVRFVQADGVVTWGGAKVVKSVTGYDVPKLMVGSLGTLGILAELTLRLHSRPECERTWLATFPLVSTAQEFAASVLDTSIQPFRFQFLNVHALAGLGGPAAPAAVAITLASVEQAVAEQGRQLAGLAERHGASIRAAAADWWDGYDRLLAGGRVLLRVGVPPANLAATAEAIDNAFGAATATVVTACAATGGFTVLPGDGATAIIARAVDALRSFAARAGGHVVIVQSPQSLRSSVDPWGPIDPPAFRLMQRIKTTFDPAGTLNPGRFVGGL